MEHKLMISKMMVFILYFYIANVSTSPLDETRLKKIDSETNSLYVRDIMRLAKAAEIRNYMNDSVDPCTDFYEFACGNWAKINPTNGHSETGYLYQLFQGIKRKKLDLLKSNSSTDAFETPVEKKAKGFYRSCIKAEGVKQSTYRNPLLKLIAEFGTMPALDGKSWNASQFDWMTTIAQIQNTYSVAIILQSVILSDMKNNTVNRFYLRKPYLHLEVRSMYLNEENQRYRDIYRDDIKNDLTETMEMPEQKAISTANEILNFEIELAKGLPDEKADSSLSNDIVATTVEEMHQKYAPEIDIKKYVLIYFGKTIDDPIYEVDPMYQKNLVEVINATSKETLANYIFYRLLTTFKPDKTDKGAARMKYCEKITEMFFAQVMENMVYRRFDSIKSQRDINLIFNELKKTFRAKLKSNELNWVSLKTRQKALNKLDATKLEITSYMDVNLTEIFGDIQIDESTFFENLLDIARNTAKIEKKELYRPKPKKLDGLAFTPVFSYKDNTIKVPVALLQPNYLWSHSYPQALKFGSLGALLGHELVHGFADSGLKFDELGNQKDWWDADSLAEIQNRTECFKDQYHQYRYDDVLLPRSEAQSENIADNSGLRLAYEAYLDWHAEALLDYDKISMETLPLLKYSEKKLFFLSFSQVWCTELDSRLRAKKVATDEHTPAKFRVIGSLSNYEEFSKEFNCDVNAAMNPKQKCVIY